jgi:hypothetical protein
LIDYSQFILCGGAAYFPVEGIKIFAKINENLRAMFIDV